MKRNQRRIRIDPQPDTDCDVPQPEQPVIEPSHPVLQAVAAHLRDHKFNYAVMASGNGLLFSMCDKTLNWVTNVIVLEEKSVLLIRSRLPLLVPATRRGAVAALLARLNFGNLIGSWQMDPDDGEVLYVTSHLFSGQNPTQEQIKVVLMVSVNAIGDEGPQILRVIQRPARPPKSPPDPSRN